MYRLVELSSGSVTIDGVDVSKIGLTDLRKALAIIPQDPVCDLLPYIYSLVVKCFDSSFSFYVSQTIKFLSGTNLTNVLVVSGTLRSNLDPFNLHDDATLWDALKRSYLVESTNRDSMIKKEDEEAGGDHTPVSRFGLDTVIEDEGGNLSVGQVGLFHSSNKYSIDENNFFSFTEVSRVFGSSVGQKCQNYHS